MDMRMVVQIAPPGVKYAHHADLSTNIARVPSQILQRGSRGAKEGIVDRFLIAASDPMQAGWQGESDHEVRRRQQQLLLLEQPLLPQVMLTLGTVPVLAGMVLIVGFIASSTMINMPTQIDCPTLSNISHCPPVTGQHPISIFFQVGLTVLMNNVSQGAHARLSISSFSLFMASVSNLWLRWV